MSVLIPDVRRAERSQNWRWWVCGLLLLATMVNYMDRQTLNQQAKRIKEAFGLEDPGYAQLESTFSNAFALGAIVMGWLADRWSVRWIYPLAVLVWSCAGFATGLVDTFFGLLLCRFLLGLAEAGNWPCALKTTQQILAPEERTLGNSILQSGAALGAILTPLILLALRLATDSWRFPFLVVGALGTLWVLLWLATVRPGDLKAAPAPSGPSLMNVLAWLVALLAADTAIHLAAKDPSWLPAAVREAGRATFAAAPWLPLLSKATATVLGILGVFWWLWRATGDDDGVPRAVFFRRFWVLAFVVVMINGTWHVLRAWMPLFLQKQHDYGDAAAYSFNAGYFISSDVGSLSAGFAVLWLARHGLAVHASRVLIFGACCALTLLTAVAAYLPAGPLMLVLLLVVAFGALGLFPAYYSFSQELTSRNQGKLTGALGCTCWLSVALLQEVMGDSARRTGSYSLGIAVAGLAPVLALGALLLFWGTAPSVTPAAAAGTRP